MKKNRNKAIYLVVFIVAICAIFGVYRYDRIKTYNQLVNSGKNYMDNGMYDKALECFNNSIDYKENEEVDKYIKKSKELKNEKDFYNNGICLAKNKKYYEALKNFHRITDKNEKLYYDANKEIRNCNEKLINESKELLKKGKCIESRNNINKVLEFDGNNKEAKNIQISIDEFIKSKKISNKYEQKDKDISKKVNSKMMITKDTAEKLVDTVKEKNVKLQYLGIEKVPYSNIRGSYKVFPKELVDEQVYTFEGLMASSGEEYAIGRYYIDFSGHIYKDTYPSDGKCIKIK